MAASIAKPTGRAVAAAETKVMTPAVVGLTVADAERAIKQSKLSYQMAGFVPAATANQNGKVASQSPAAGTQVVRSSVVSIKVYRSAQKIVEAEARAKRDAEARKKLTESILKKK